MRTTLTLDHDVAAAIEHLRRTRKARRKDILNEALRRGRLEMITGRRRRKTFRTRSVRLGSLLIASLDNVGGVLAYAEGENFK